MSSINESDTSGQPAPRISVIVPTYNRASILAKCLEALSSQTSHTSLYEVIVSDDGSSDQTAATVRRFAASGFQLIYLHQKNAGANSARNHAIRCSRGSILLLINDDTIATPSMLAEHLAMHDHYQDERVAVLGRMTVSPSLPPSRLARLHLDLAFESLRGRRELDWHSFYTCNVSVKKTLLEKGGMFEERIRYYEDLELGERLSHHGLRVIYCPAALGYHEHFLTEEELFSVASREAKALAVWFRKAPQLSQVLGPLGFEPGLPVSARLRRSLMGLVVNRVTIPFWQRVARHCPDPFNTLSLKIYSQIYQAIRRGSLARELRTTQSPVNVQ